MTHQGAETEKPSTHGPADKSAASQRIWAKVPEDRVLTTPDEVQNLYAQGAFRYRFVRPDGTQSEVLRCYRDKFCRWLMGRVRPDNTILVKAYPPKQQRPARP